MAEGHDAPRRSAAGRPLTVLAGPHGHPFHPMVVTVPIGAWVASVVFDLASHWVDEGEAFVVAAFWLIAIGLAGALVAAVLGVLDLLVIPPGTQAFTTALVHMGLTVVAVALFAVSLGLRYDATEDASVGAGAMSLSIIALVLVAVAGWLGGKLTYTFGVRVADAPEEAAGRRA